MPIELSRAKVKFTDAEGNSAQINTMALESLEDIQQLTEESIANVNAAKASSLGDISNAATQAINALDNAIGEVPLEDADDLRYTIAENATSPTTKAYAVGEYFYYGLTDDNKSDLCRVTKAIASGDTIYKTGADKNCESVTKGIANVVNEEVTDLKSALNATSYIDEIPFFKELYINDAGRTANVERIYDIDLRERDTRGYIYFRNSDNSAITAHIIGYQNNEFINGLIPIYSGQSGTVLYGYAIIDWKWILETATLGSKFTINKPIESIAYDLNFSPRICSFLNDATINYVDNRVNPITQTIGQSDQTLVDSSTDFVNVNTVYRHGGIVKTQNGWNTTDFIACNPGDTLDFSLVSWNHTVSGTLLIFDSISYFDSNYTYVGGIYNPSDSQGALYSGTATVPSGVAYIKVLGMSEYVANPYVILVGTGILKEISDLELPHISAKVCFIGDSLTQGLTGGTSSTDFTFADKPWPTIFKESLANRGFDITVKNFGRRGLSPETYWASAIPVNGQYHSPASGEPGDTIEFDNTVDAVIIMLGTNGHLDTSSAAEGDTTAKGQSYIANYAAYCNIVEYIMANTENHAQIILVAPIYANDNSHEEKMIETLPTIKAIGEKYQIPVINGLYESGLGKFNKSVFYNTTDLLHLNQAGYHKFGTFIASKFVSLYSTFDMDELPT